MAEVGPVRYIKVCLGFSSSPILFRSSNHYVCLFLQKKFQLLVHISKRLARSEMGLQ